MNPKYRSSIVQTRSFIQSLRNVRKNHMRCAKSPPCCSTRLDPYVTLHDLFAVNRSCPAEHDETISDLSTYLGFVPNTNSRIEDTNSGPLPSQTWSVPIRFERAVSYTYPFLVSTMSRY